MIGPTLGEASSPFLVAREGGYGRQSFPAVMRDQCRQHDLQGHPMQGIVGGAAAGLAGRWQDGWDSRSWQSLNQGAKDGIHGHQAIHEPVLVVPPAGLLAEGAVRFPGGDAAGVGIR